MEKSEIVSAAVSSIQAAQTQALSDGIGAVVDQVLAQAPAGGGLSQSDVDAAVASALAAAKVDSDKALADSQALDSQALADAQAKAASDLAQLQSALDAMTAKEQLEESAVSDVVAKIAQVQASFDAIKALFAPAQG